MLPEAGQGAPFLPQRKLDGENFPSLSLLVVVLPLKNIPLLQMCPGNRPPKNPFEALSKKSFQSLILPLLILLAI